MSIQIINNKTPDDKSGVLFYGKKYKLTPDFIQQFI